MFLLCLIITLVIASEEYSSTASLSERSILEVDIQNVKKLPRFWTNTGFCPPAPTNDSSTLAKFFLGEQSLRNLDYISALPNSGLKYVRIHWLVNLITFIGFSENHGFQYDFSNLDNVLDHLNKLRLYPVVEFMGNPSNRLFNQKQFSQTHLWKDLVYRMINRYINNSRSLP
ncbi:Alpha-L-iduronidase [Pseudolycoriella hygida]|uniref:Alpha-L-iduronidase n=1 Tax=Pseudolycoriella hygida TaxID=35572 RepID=A0A9Q0NGN2_9DIPT|nr:Alpha-L-iduronidase [Pseudolycoriella hygida]